MGIAVPCLESGVSVESSGILAGPMGLEPSSGGHEPIDSGDVFW
jgi:hypothetical protein